MSKRSASNSGRHYTINVALVAVVLAAGLAGCTEAPASGEAPGAGATLLAQSVAGLEAPQPSAGTQTLRWTGDCASNCSALSFQLDIPAGSPLRLEASVTWAYRPVDHHVHAYSSSLTHTAAGDTPVAPATNLYFSSVTLWDEPISGNYELRLHPATSVAVPFEAIVQLEAPPQPDANGDFLPNLGALVPAHLAIYDQGIVLPGPRMPVTGCQVPETIEQGSTRCLRFSSGFTNTGTGDLQAYLESPTEVDGQWIQIIETADGQREQPAGIARFHPSHSHFHYEGALEATVYEYDLDHFLRGEAISAGRKTGFCFEDWGLSQPGAAGTSQGGFRCLEGEQPLPVELVEATIDPNMGVSAGWYDLYMHYLPDQYVDMAGVPDGVYELVNVADPDGTLAESDVSDNEASVVFKLTGNDVEILGTPEELQAAA